MPTLDATTAAFGPAASYADVPPRPGVREFIAARGEAATAADTSLGLRFNPATVVDLGGAHTNDLAAAALLRMDENPSVLGAIEKHTGSRLAKTRTFGVFVANRYLRADLSQVENAPVLGHRDRLVVFTVSADESALSVHVLTPAGVHPLGTAAVPTVAQAVSRTRKACRQFPSRGDRLDTPPDNLIAYAQDGTRLLVPIKRLGAAAAAAKWERRSGSGVELRRAVMSPSSAVVAPHGSLTTEASLIKLGQTARALVVARGDELTYAGGDATSEPLGSLSQAADGEVSTTLGGGSTWGNSDAVYSTQYKSCMGRNSMDECMRCVSDNIRTYDVAITATMTACLIGSAKIAAVIAAIPVLGWVGAGTVVGACLIIAGGAIALNHLLGGQSHEACKKQVLVTPNGLVERTGFLISEIERVNGAIQTVSGAHLDGKKWHMSVDEVRQYMQEFGVPFYVDAPGDEEQRVYLQRRHSTGRYFLRTQSNSWKGDNLGELKTIS